MKKFLFVTILILAAVLRLWQLPSVPPSPSLDEVSIGYNAYSILNTGADEFGTKFPILLRAYDDWRPALYVYLVIPFVKLFGLSVLAVRLPSALLSIATVVCCYLLVREWQIKASKINSSIPYLVALLVAVSPWHIYISRLGHEVNAALSFLVFGIYCFFLYLNKRKIHSLLFSAVFLGLSFDSYQSTKIVIPLVLISLFIVFRKELLTRKKDIVISVFIGLLIIGPVLLESTRPNALIRFQGTSVFNSRDTILSLNAKRSLTDLSENNKLLSLFHNRRFVDFPIFTQAYLSHFNPPWLFINQDNEDFKIPNFGLLYIIELPFLIIGIFYFLQSKLDKKIKVFIASWLFISIIPGALTTGFPHAMRVINIIPIPQVFIAYGIAGLVTRFINYQKIVVGIICVLYGITIIWFLHQYFIHFPQLLSYQFQYGVLKTFDEVKKIEGNYDQIIVSNKDTLRASNMYYLFSSKYDPNRYLEMGGTGSGWFDNEHSIGKYHFGDPRNIKTNKKNVLYIVNPEEVGQNKRIQTLYFLNGEEAVIIAEK